MKIETIGIVGAGQMGNGIAQVAATSGLQAIMSDIKEEFVQRGLQNIIKLLSRNVEKGRMSGEEKEATLGRVKTTVNMAKLSGCDYVIEAATESEEIKFRIFRDLDEICRPEVILATNTSSIPIGRIASQTKRPEKIIGMHFMNPVPLMQLVEVIPGLVTSEKTFKTTWDLAVKFGKTPIKAGDYPAFIANRVLMPMINEAIFCLYHSVGARDDIDTVMKLGSSSSWIWPSRVMAMTSKDSARL